jgi:hypothetical protein
MTQTYGVFYHSWFSGWYRHMPKMYYVQSQFTFNGITILILLKCWLLIYMVIFSRSGPHGWEVIIGVERSTQIPEEGARECNSYCQSFGSVQSHHTRLVNPYCQGHDAQARACVIPKTTKSSRYVLNLHSSPNTLNINSVWLSICHIDIHVNFK